MAIPDTSLALVVEFTLIGDTGLVYRVLHQDDTRINRGDTHFKRHDLTIESSKYPFISINERQCEMFIRGRDSRFDARGSIIDFKDNTHRAAFIESARRTVAEFNRNIHDNNNRNSHTPTGRWYLCDGQHRPASQGRYPIRSIGSLWAGDSIILGDGLDPSTLAGREWCDIDIAPSPTIDFSRGVIVRAQTEEVTP